MHFATLLLTIIPILFAITVHEASHGYVALYYGDQTAKQAGRLTLNPINHIDPIGTVIVPLITLAISLGTGSSFIFGWAKPVPVNPRNFRNFRMGERMTAVSGPLSNLIMMILWGSVGLVLGYKLNGITSLSEPLTIMSNFGVSINAFLFTLNMLPILPLDGGRFVNSFLPAKWSIQFQKVEPYGTWIVLILLITDILMQILIPFVTFLTNSTFALASLILHIL